MTDPRQELFFGKAIPGEGSETEGVTEHYKQDEQQDKEAHVEGEANRVIRMSDPNNPEGVQFNTSVLGEPPLQTPLPLLPGGSRLKTSLRSKIERGKYGVALRYLHLTSSLSPFF